MTLHLSTYACNACEDTACEVSTEAASRPALCPLGLVPDWRRGDE